ncbi:MAG: DUF4344 domain-containing metallopeptidase [Kofleriaceae bacterium]|nr:DUF4344 domain-containing metallopeptidase [Kofleriaceae bacterium]
MRLSPTLLSVLVVTLSASSCSKKNDKKEESSLPTAEATAKSDKTEAPKKDAEKTEIKGQVDKGDFTFKYGMTENKDLDAYFKENKLLEDMATDLNALIAMPKDILIEFGDCGEPNAYYDPEIGHIKICYELMEAFLEDYDNAFKEDPEEDLAFNAMIGATMFTIFHELGHALVDVLKLPVTGKEEDSVDNLASVVMIASGEEGQQMALDGATAFMLEAEKTNLRDLAYWDEHSLSAQRFYNVICMVYGSNPEKYAYLVDDGDLPEERAERCPEEYKRISDSWDTLLEPHFLGFGQGAR